MLYVQMADGKVVGVSKGRRQRVEEERGVNLASVARIAVCLAAASPVDFWFDTGGVGTRWAVLFLGMHPMRYARSYCLWSVSSCTSQNVSRLPWVVPRTT